MGNAGLKTRRHVGIYLNKTGKLQNNEVFLVVRYGF